jgi:GTPase SAR1 family protein
MPRQGNRPKRDRKRASIDPLPARAGEPASPHRILAGHKGGVRSVAVQQDGRRVLSLGTDETIRLWDLETGVELRRFDDRRNSVAVVSDMRALSVSDDGMIQLWDLESGIELRRLYGNSRNVRSIAVLPDGRRCLSGGDDNWMCLSDLDTGEVIKWFDCHCMRILSVEALPDGRLALSVSEDVVQLWDLETGVELPPLGETVVFLPDGRRALSGSNHGEMQLWDLETGAAVRTFRSANGVFSIAALPDSRRVLVLGRDNTVGLWDVETGAQLRSFEGHTNSVSSIAVLPDGRRALSSSSDGTLRVWDIEPISADADTIEYTTARIALLGDSGVGKTGLGWRIAHGAFREHSSTHGQQFWVIDQLSRTRQDGTQCEAVLWDLAGQPDYRLIHALFLEQADLGLLVFDPTNRERPLAGVEYWLRHLRAATTRAGAAGKSAAIAGAPTLLVAARADRGTPTLTNGEIEAFCKRQEISNYIVTSAKENAGVPELIEQIKATVPWDRMTATTTTRTFKRIKEHVLKLKAAAGTPLLLPRAGLRRQLEVSDCEWQFTDDEMMTAVHHLANHGYVARLQRANGDEAILLTPDLLVNLVSSIVLEVRRHERGLGLVDEARLLAGDYRLPELDGLSGTDRSTLLDAAASLFLRRNLCFRETLNGRTCLVFPSLINEKRPTIDDGSLLDDASYRVSGAVETVYAALVVQLGYTNLFHSDAHWQNQAQYALEEGEICGFRQIDGREGEIELVLSYSPGAGDDTRQLFQSVFERFLKRRPVEIRRFPMLSCRSGHPQLRDAIRLAVENSQEFFFCSECGDKLTTPQIVEIGVSADTAVRKAEDRADYRTNYEVAVAWAKAFRRDRGDGDKKPSCFISYAWGERWHERWVEQLADYLQNADVAVTLDRWHSRPAGAISRFIERIEQSDFVCAAGTPPYLQKDQAAETDPVVQAELRLIKSKLMSRDVVHDTVIPLLCMGTREEAFPPLFKDSVLLDFREEADFFPRLFELVLTIHRIPFEDKMARQHRDELGASEIERRRQAVGAFSA